MAGRPSAPTTIVPQGNNNGVIVDQMPSTMRDLVLLTANTLDCIRWFASKRLIHNSRTCDRCNVSMKFISAQGRDYVDGYAWYCGVCKCKRNIRKDSFFDGTHIKLTQIVDIIY